MNTADDALKGQPEAPLSKAPESPWARAMELALKEARLAGLRGEVPVGAVALDAGGRVLAMAGNAPIGQNDVSAHAEMRVLRQACRNAGNYRLPGVTVVSTLEPCLMCLGALVAARVARVVFGAPDPKAGAVVSRLTAMELPFLNHRFEVVGGVLADEAGALLREFFKARRKLKPQDGKLGA